VALESRDVEGLTAALHPGVTFHSPLIDVPVRGRDRVLGLFAVLATVFEEPEITDELVAEGTRAFVFRLTVDDHPIEGVDYVRLDADGLVRSISVLMRPLASVQALARRMAEPLAELVSEQSPDDARRVVDLRNLAASGPPGDH
jgi:hypothetical protein